MFLKTITVHRIVGTRERQIQAGLATFPTQLSEPLAHVRVRVGPPAIIAKSVNGQIPTERRSIDAAIFQFHRSARMASVCSLKTSAFEAAPVLGLNRHRAA